jgi:hypothetical protein
MRLIKIMLFIKKISNYDKLYGEISHSPVLGSKKGAYFAESLHLRIQAKKFDLHLVEHLAKRYIAL